MSLKVSGYQTSGMVYRGKPTLNSIGNVIAWYDYRKGAVIEDYAGIDRVNSLQDLGKNGFDLLSSSVSNDVTRPKVLSGGFGMNNSSPSAVAMRSLYSDPAGIVHKGHPCFLMFVASLDNTAGVTGPIMFNTLLAGTPGAQFRIDPANRALNFILFNDSGVNISNQATSNNTVPLDQFCVFARLYYGSGTGSNNVKMWIENSLSQFTSNPTYGVGPSSQYTSWTSIGNVEFTGKMSIAYDLTGFSPAQCDAFATLAFETLKQDTEYSGLITP